MSAVPTQTPDVLHQYELAVASQSGADELIGPDGVRADQRELADVITELGPAGLARRRSQTSRFVQDDGITYGSGPAGRQGRNWVIDPLPMIIDMADWARLETALRQRSLVLDALLTDLYGARRVVAEGVVPPEVLAAHPGFLRTVDGIRIPGRHQLVHVATDLGRASDGSWVAFGDRADAPSGAGYAMATRRITTNVMTRLHRDTPIARLRSFFHTMSASLLDAAPEQADDPRVVLLSPGAESETAYDQAFLATLLGLPMVESVDLFMRDGVLRRRTTLGDEEVDVVLRRVDADWCDPLDLRGESRLGVPGLVEAARRGTLSVINPLGAGVLENPGLTRLMPQLTQFYLGEDPLLATVPTYWCGDASERAHVLAHLDHLVIKPLARGQRDEGLFGDEMTESARERLTARIEAEPWQWCAQEPVQFSTAPVIRGGGIEPREIVLRAFAVSRDEGYEIMHGALGRVARRRDQRTISNATGALAKDVWVLVGETPTSVDLPARRHRGVTARHEVGLSARSAGNLFWLGRYAERAEASARLLRVSADLTEDHSRRPGGQGFAAMSVMLAGVSRVMTLQPGFIPDEHGLYSDAHGQLRAALLDAERPGTVAFAVSHMVSCAQAVREILSLDTWLVLARLERGLADELPADSMLRPVLVLVQEALLAFAGIMAQNMIRDESWAYIDLGSRMERAQLTVSLLRTTLLTQRSPNIEAMITEAVLTAGESIITHRRRQSSGTGPEQGVDSVFDLLWLDPSNPRSLAYQLDRMIEDFAMVDAPAYADRCRQLRGRLEALDADGLASANRDVVAGLADELTVELRSIAVDFEAERLTALLRLQNQPIEWQVLPSQPADGAGVQDAGVLR